MAKINEYPLERFTFGDDDYYDIDYWDGAVYQSAKIKGSTIKAAMSGGGSILAADGQVMPADRSQDLANFKLSLRDGVFTLGTVDADFGSIFQATKDSGNTYATIKTKTNDNAALILDINTADVTGAGNKTAFIQFRDAGVSKYIFGTNTGGVANFSDNSFFISSSAQLTDYIQAIDRDTESFVIGRQVGNPLNDNTKFLINNGNSFDTTELDNVLMLSSRDETKKWSVDKDLFFSATKIKGDSTSGTDSQLLLQDSTGVDLWDFRNNGDVYAGKDDWAIYDNQATAEPVLAVKRVGGHNQFTTGNGDLSPSANWTTFLAVGKDGVSSINADDLNFRNFVFANNNGNVFSVHTRTGQTTQILAQSGSRSVSLLENSSISTFVQEGSYFITKYRSSVAGRNTIVYGDSFSHTRASSLTAGVQHSFQEGDVELYGGDRTSAGSVPSPRLRLRGTYYDTVNNIFETKRYINTNNATPFAYEDTTDVSNKLIQRIDLPTGAMALKCNTTELADAKHFTSSWSAHVDEGANNLVFKVLYSDGTTFKTGTVALT